MQTLVRNSKPDLKTSLLSVAVAPNVFAFVAEGDSNAINLTTTTKCIRIQTYAISFKVTIYLHLIFVIHCFLRAYPHLICIYFFFKQNYIIWSHIMPN